MFGGKDMTNVLRKMLRIERKRIDETPARNAPVLARHAVAIACNRKKHPEIGKSNADNRKTGEHSRPVLLLPIVNLAETTRLCRVRRLVLRIKKQWR